MRGRSRSPSKETGNKKKTRRDKKRHFNLLMEFDVDQISREYSSGILPWGSFLFFSLFADGKRCHQRGMPRMDTDLIREDDGSPSIARSSKTCTKITVKRQTILCIVSSSQSVKNYQASAALCIFFKAWKCQFFRLKSRDAFSHILQEDFKRLKKNVKEGSLCRHRPLVS